MYEIEFYQRADGSEPAREYLEQLRQAAGRNKDARIRYKKTVEYMTILEQTGTRCGEPFVKYIDASIWELRPTSDRYFFVYWKDNKFVILHHYVKKSQKMSKREFDKAKAYLRDFLERNE